MKKNIIIVLMLIVLFATGSYFYRYFTFKDLVEEFVVNLREGHGFNDHPQEEIFLELNELNIVENVNFKGVKPGFFSGTAEVNAEISGKSYTLEIDIKKDEFNNWYLFLRDLAVNSGFLHNSSQYDNEFVYEIEQNGGLIELISHRKLDVVTGDVVRFIVLKNNIVDVSPLDEVNLSKVLSFDSSTITGELEGTFQFRNQAKIFGKESRLYVGIKNVDLFLKNDEVIGVVTRNNYVPDKIRVLINDTGFKNINHSTIKIYSNGETTIYSKLEDKSIKVLPQTPIVINVDNGNTSIKILGQSIVFSSRVYMKSSDGFYFDNIKRGAVNNLSPLYRGSFEIFSQGGKIYIINELDLEHYLYGVLPSEMPVSFGEEALRVQAIAARTYAVNNIYASTYGKYTAHVVDSVMSQVYNNTMEHSVANRAVNDTKGQVITYQGKVIDAKFSSTSSGYTANAHEVWDVNGVFPAKKIPYLVSKYQGVNNIYSIKTEEEFSQFIKSIDVQSFDRDSPFFRWQIEMSELQLRKSLEDNLAQRQKAQPKHILTLKDGEFISMEIPNDPLGSVKDLVVVERGEGGNIMVLDIVGENGTYRINKEYNIRFTLRPIDNHNPILIHRSDGSVLSNYSILPSAFITFDKVYSENQLNGIKIYGGGNGHGVGMSQYGVLGMLKAGFKLDEIIQHYYTDSEIVKIY